MPNCDSDETTERPPASQWEPDRGFWAGRRVLVTGGSGFLGRHVVAMLASIGSDVAVLGRSGGTGSGPGAVFAADLGDRGAVAEAVLSHRPESVFHLGGESDLARAVADPCRAYEANVTGTWNVLVAASEVGAVEQVVVASSDRVYGAQEPPFSEAMAPDPAHPYAASKLCAETIARAHASTYGLPVAITRCCNLYGPGDRAWDRLVPGTFRAVLRGERPRLRSPSWVERDLLWVGDAAAGHVLLAEAMAGDASLSGESFNLAPARATALGEVVDEIQRAAGTELEVESAAGPQPDGVSQHSCADKARVLLGWVPGVDLASGLAVSATWYRRHLAGAAPAEFDHVR